MGRPKEVVGPVVTTISVNQHADMPPLRFPVTVAGSLAPVPSEVATECLETVTDQEEEEEEEEDDDKNQNNKVKNEK